MDETLEERMHHARDAFARGDYASAEATYRRALQQAPRHVDAHLNLGATLLVQQRPAEAGEVYRAALNLAPDNVLGGFGLAKAHLAGQCFDEALAVLDRFRTDAAIPPGMRAEFFKLIGVAQVGKKAWDAGVEAFEEYAALQPEGQDPLDCLYRLYTLAGRQEDALRVLEQLTTCFPGRLDAWLALVKALRGRDQFKRMHGIIEQLLAAAPRDPVLANAVVAVALEEKRYAHARLYFEHALENMPDLKVGAGAALKIAEGLA
jgi:tetratricopeptide (TPR) repeat protein